MVKVVRRLKTPETRWDKDQGNRPLPDDSLLLGEDMEVVEEPIGWRSLGVCGVQKLRRHKLESPFSKIGYCSTAVS